MAAWGYCCAIYRVDLNSLLYTVHCVFVCPPCIYRRPVVHAAVDHRELQGAIYPLVK